MGRKAPWGSEREGVPPRDKVECTTGLHDGIHLSKKLHAHLGEGSRNSHCVKNRQDNRPNVNKDLKDCPV